MNMRRLVTGAAQRIRSHLEPASPEKEARLAICRHCPFNSMIGTAAGTCMACGCPIERKAHLHSSSCEKGRW